MIRSNPMPAEESSHEAAVKTIRFLHENQKLFRASSLSL